MKVYTKMFYKLKSQDEIEQGQPQSDNMNPAIIQTKLHVMKLKRWHNIIWIKH